jgi:hypothetical protein
MEIKPMKNVIEKAIEALARKSGEALEPHQAMQLAQAALNLAHTQQILNQINK